MDRNTEEKWLVPGTTPSVSVTTTTQGSTTSEVQTVGFQSMNITGGTFTLSFDGQTTSGIAYNASAATVQTALSGLSTIGTGNISVTKLTNSSTSQTWQLTFQGALAETNVSQVTVDSSGVSAVPPIDNVQQTDTQGGTATNEVQSVSLANATGGTFTLSFDGQTTAHLAHNATAAQVDGALDALSTIDNVTVTGNAGGPYSISFGGTQSGQNVSELTADASGLTNLTLVRTLSFGYDAASRLTDASDPAASYSYFYDVLGRMTQQTQAITGLAPQVILDQKFDAVNNRTELKATIGTTSDFINTYTFDPLNRMTQMIQQAQTGGSAVLAKRVDFTYNAAGQFDTITRYNDTAGTQQVIATSHAYDGIGRLTTLDHKKGATSLAKYDYTFDAASRITSVTSLIDGLTSYSYDDTDQLTAADHSSQTDESYSFDANGNRTNTGYTTGTNNRLTSDGTYNYEYDDEGNRTARQKISTGERTEYQWDHRNRLTKVTEKNASGQVTRTAEHSYDVFNRWVRRRVDMDGAGPGAPTDAFFVHDGQQIVLQFDGGQASNLDHRYLWGPAVDQLLADQDAVSLTFAGTVLWPLGDHLGTLRNLASYDSGTDTTTVANHRRYDSFGNLVGETNAAVDELFGFTGRALDDSTGLQNNWNRWYDARVGRWISEDPIGFLGGDTNLSRSVNNNPPNFTDPLGLMGIVPPWEIVRQFFELQREASTVWENTDDMPAPKRVYVTGGTTVATLVGVRGVSDACSRHDAVDAHEQSISERAFDGVTGTVGLVSTGFSISGMAMAGLRVPVAPKGGAFDLSQSVGAARASEMDDTSRGSTNQAVGNYWIKEVDPNAGKLAQWWGRGSLDAQASGLSRLGDMAPSHLYRSGCLVIRDVGEFAGTRADFWRIWREGSCRLRTPFNDIRPRNIGANGQIFDPVLHPIHEGVYWTGSGIIVIGGGAWVYYEIEAQ